MVTVQSDVCVEPPLPKQYAQSMMTVCGGLWCIYVERGLWSIVMEQVNTYKCVHIDLNSPSHYALTHIVMPCVQLLYFCVPGILTNSSLYTPVSVY